MGPPPQEYSTIKSRESKAKPWYVARAVVIWRVTFIAFLLGIAALFGYLAHEIISDSETTLAEEQYYSLAERAVTESHDILKRKADAIKAMAAVAGATAPTLEDWPLVAVTDYDSIAVKINDISADGAFTAFSPIVWPDQVDAWETFAYDYYSTYYLDNTTGYSNRPFKGIYNVDAAGTPEADANGETDWDNRYNFTTPIFQISDTTSRLQMLNTHSLPTNGFSQERAYDCAIRSANKVFGDGTGSYTPWRQRALSAEEQTPTSEEALSHAEHADRMHTEHVVHLPGEKVKCGDTSDFFWYDPTSYNLEGGEEMSTSALAAFINEPIFPAHNDSQIVGFITTTVVWASTFEGVFPETVSGIDAVLSTYSTPYRTYYTYTIENGQAILKGEGDLHDTSYDDYMRKGPMGVTCMSYSHWSHNYTVSFYPTDKFFETYQTNNPRTATIGAVVILLLTSLIFIFYDHFVQKEFTAKQIVLDAKRKFMRYISHEVRTPLNSVCMGLKLLADEIKGCDSEKLFGPVKRESTAERDSMEGNTDGVVVEVAQKNSSPTLKKTDSRETFTTDSSMDTINEWLTLTEESLHNCQAAVNVLNDLLNFDKVESGTLSLDVSVFGGWELIQATGLEFRLQAKKAKVNLMVDYSHVQIGGNSEQVPVAVDQLRFCSQAEFVREDLRNLKVAGDIVRLTQVLRNLISNALKFTPERERVVVRVGFVDELDSLDAPQAEEIRTGDDRSVNLRSVRNSMMSLKNISQRFVSSRSGSYRSTNNSKKDVTVEKIVLGNKETYMGIKAGYLVVNVEDYGAGMTPEQLAKVFGEGTQFNVNKLQAGNGSGLGLFIAKGIAELHGGSLTVSSPGLGMGTTFTLMVPLFEILESGKVQKDDVNTARTNEASGRSAKEGQPLLGLDRDKKLRVLVVDDASSNRKMLSRILQNRGHICEQAADGLEAVEKYFKSEVTSQPFDTILMDSEMPNMNGPDAAKKIRELGCQYLITGVSGNVLPEDVANYVAHGANGVLPKPLNIDDLENLWYNHKVMPPRMLTADQRKARNDYGYELNMRKNDPAAASLSSLLDAHSKTAESSPIKESPIKKKASSSFHEAAPITAHTTLDLDADPLAKNSKTRLPPIDPTTRKVLPSSEGTGLDVV